MNGYVYRIYTEDKDNIGLIAEILERYGYPGFTAYRNQSGYWKGTAEPSLIVEVIETDSPNDGNSIDFNWITAMAEEIGRAGGQAEVLVTQQKLDQVAFVATS